MEGVSSSLLAFHIHQHKPFQRTTYAYIHALEIDGKRGIARYPCKQGVAGLGVSFG